MRFVVEFYMEDGRLQHQCFFGVMIPSHWGDRTLYVFKSKQNVTDNLIFAWRPLAIAPSH
jgi:hypothetical protein